MAGYSGVKRNYFENTNKILPESVLFLKAGDPIPEEPGTFEVEYQDTYSSQNDSVASDDISDSENKEKENELDNMDEVIVKCIFESLDIIQETGA